MLQVKPELQKLDYIPDTETRKEWLFEFIKNYSGFLDAHKLILEGLLFIEMEITKEEYVILNSYDEKYSKNGQSHKFRYG